jgi:hypothetical protein
MGFDIATGRARAGLAVGDTTQDLPIQAAMNVALAYAENYCDRNFGYNRETITKTYSRFDEKIFVDRYPIAKIWSVSHTGGSVINANQYNVHKNAGLILLDSGSGKVDVDYEGGFLFFPADLEYALWKMFASVWADFDPAAGGGVVAAGPAIGSVKKQTIVGVGSIEFETGSAPAAASGTVAADLSAVMPGAVQATLDSYARRVA